MGITDEIRKQTLALASEETIYRIAKDAGLSWPSLKRFMQGGGLRSDQLDKLADHLGLTVVKKGQKK